MMTPDRGPILSSATNSLKIVLFCMSARTIQPANFHRDDLQLSGECSVIEGVSPNACVCSKSRHIGASPV